MTFQIPPCHFKCSAEHSEWPCCHSKHISVSIVRSKSAVLLLLIHCLLLLSIFVGV